MNARFVIVVLGGSLLAGGCAGPSAEERAQAALARERSICGTPPLVEDATIVSPVIIVDVQPLYDARYVNKIAPTPRMMGARVYLRALPSLTPEWIARTLECHEARLTLRRVAAAANDPYWLPGGALLFSVQSDGDGFVVEVRAESSDAGQQVLERARAFLSAAAH